MRKRKLRISVHGILAVASCFAIAVTIGCAKRSAIDRTRGVDPIAEFKALVSAHIQDPGRRAEIMEIVNNGETRLNQFYDYYEQHTKRISALSADYRSTRADFEEATSEFNTTYREFLMGLVTDRFAVKKLMTREEWALYSEREKSFITD